MLFLSNNFVIFTSSHNTFVSAEVWKCMQRTAFQHKPPSQDDRFLGIDRPKLQLRSYTIKLANVFSLVLTTHLRIPLLLLKSLKHPGLNYYHVYCVLFCTSMKLIILPLIPIPILITEIMAFAIGNIHWLIIVIVLFENHNSYWLTRLICQNSANDQNLWVR